MRAGQGSGGGRDPRSSEPRGEAPSLHKRERGPEGGGQCAGLLGGWGAGRLPQTTTHGGKRFVLSGLQTRSPRPAFAGLRPPGPRECLVPPAGQRDWHSWCPCTHRSHPRTRSIGPHTHTHPTHAHTCTHTHTCSHVLTTHAHTCTQHMHVCTLVPACLHEHTHACAQAAHESCRLHPSSLSSPAGRDPTVQVTAQGRRPSEDVGHGPLQEPSVWPENENEPFLPGLHAPGADRDPGGVLTETGRC